MCLRSAFWSHFQQQMSGEPGSRRKPDYLSAISYLISRNVFLRAAVDTGMTALMGLLKMALSCPFFLLTFFFFALLPCSAFYSFFSIFSGTPLFACLVYRANTSQVQSTFFFISRHRVDKREGGGMFKPSANLSVSLHVCLYVTAIFSISLSDWQRESVVCSVFVKQKITKNVAIHFAIIRPKTCFRWDYTKLVLLFSNATS